MAPRIESFFLSGPAGRIECLLKSPADAGRATASGVVCHPHPLFGGTMHNKVVHAVAEAIVQAGIPVLRFNFRGVGASGGRHDEGNGERADLQAVLDHLASLSPGRPLLVAGYSFGARIALEVGCGDDRAEALLGIGTPLALYDFGFLRECRKPLTLIQGELDPFSPIGLLMTLAAALPGGARVVTIPGAAHGFEGRLGELSRKVSESIPSTLLSAS